MYERNIQKLERSPEMKFHIKVEEEQATPLILSVVSSKD